MHHCSGSNTLPFGVLLFPEGRSGGGPELHRIGPLGLTRWGHGRRGPLVTGGPGVQVEGEWLGEPWSRGSLGFRLRGRRS